MALTVKTASLAEALASPQWAALAESSGVDLSMGPEWFCATVSALGIDGSARVFMLSDGDAPVAIVPYVERSQRVLGIPMRSRECPGSYLVAYHPEIIATIDTQAVIELFLADSARDCDLVVLPNLVKDGRTSGAVHAAARKLRLGMLSRAGHVSPYITIGAGWEQFVAARDRKFRYKLRNALKQLQAAGKVVESRFETGADTNRLLEEILHIEANSWKAQAGMSVSGSKVEQDYYRRLLPFLAARDALRANVLYLDSAPVAYCLSYLSRGAFRQLKTSYDEKHAGLAPGFAVIQAQISHAFASGAREYDFLGDAMTHKKDWTTQVREHESLYLFPRTLRGSLVGGAALLIARLRAARHSKAET